MDIKDAKSLVVKLTNAVYEAGLWEDHFDKTLTPKWQKRAEEIGDEIVRHLTSQSSGRDIRCALCDTEIELSTIICRDCRGEP